MTPYAFWHSIAWPLCKMLGAISLSLLLANLIESLNWTRFLARFARPLIRLGHMKDIVGASFSMNFFSGLASNTMLAEAHQEGRISERELILANLFNSLPTYFLHLPTLIFVTVPFLGNAAALYVGITFAAAMARSLAIVMAGRVLLPSLPEGCLECQLPEKGPTWREALQKSWKRFKRRIVRICCITAPVYGGMVLLNKWGFFETAEHYIATNLGFMTWLSPKAASVVVFGMAAEFTAGLAAAGALLSGGELPVKEVVLALLLGNLLSSPMRAFRHQFPYYAGIFKPALAAKLILHNQAFRAFSLLVAGLAFYWIAP